MSPWAVEMGQEAVEGWTKEGRHRLGGSGEPGWVIGREEADVVCVEKKPCGCREEGSEELRGGADRSTSH